MLREIRSTYFSWNLDEATSSNHDRILTVLVSYFSQGKKVVCEHLASINVPAVTTENKLVNIFKEKSMSWKNILATLMDSCNVMRGSKNGLEKQTKKKLQHNLLDIDRDSCHHTHNAVKKLESILMPIYNYFL